METIATITINCGCGESSTIAGIAYNQYEQWLAGGKNGPFDGSEPLGDMLRTSECLACYYDRAGA